MPPQPCGHSCPRPRAEPGPSRHRRPSGNTARSGGTAPSHAGTAASRQPGKPLQKQQRPGRGDILKKAALKKKPSVKNSGKPCTSALAAHSRGTQQSRLLSGTRTPSRPARHSWLLSEARTLSLPTPPGTAGCSAGAHCRPAGTARSGAVPPRRKGRRWLRNGACPPVPAQAALAHGAQLLFAEDVGEGHVAVEQLSGPHAPARAEAAALARAVEPLQRRRLHPAARAATGEESAAAPPSGT